MTHPLDVSNLRQMILDGPDQLRTGFEIAKDIKVKGDFRSIEISGMGGSALPGNLFRVYLSELARKNDGTLPRLAIFQNRFYTLPHEAYGNCLNFICSYSGNTEETVASFEEAIKAKLPVIALSCGGKIETMAKEHGIPHIKLPIPTPNFQPRVGTGYFFGALFQVLVNQGLVQDTREELLGEAQKVKDALEKLEEQGKVLAEKMAGKTPVIYASTKYKSVAMIWKIKLNENAKTPAFWNYFPELNHNEMVGWTNPQGKFLVIMLRDPGDLPANLKRFTVTAELLRKQGVEVEILDMEGDSAYTKMFMSIALSDFASYYLALSYNQDPTPVQMVEDLKKKLAA